MTKHNMRSTHLPVSVCIIACNEEANIVGCVKSVRTFDDIVIIVDSHTTDKTAHVAEGLGCRVFIEEWKGDGPQKQSAIDKSRHDWVFLLDADERLPDKSLRIIRENFVEGNNASAYSLKRRSYIGSRKISYSGWWPDRVTRLFNKKAGKMRGITHSTFETSGKIVYLDALIEHYSYENYFHLVQKMNKYSSWMADELATTHRKVNFFTPVIHGLWMFFRTFILKKGFLDGLDGLVISLVNAVGSFFKYAKLLELQKTKPSGD